MNIAAKVTARCRLGVRRGIPTRKLNLGPNTVINGPYDKVAIHEISRSGFLISGVAELREGELLEVQHPDIADLSARVIWKGDEYYACAFLRQIAASELARIRLGSRKSGNKDAAQPGPATEPGKPETLGTRIKRLRKKRRYTMVHFASLIGVSKPTLWRWESDAVLPRQETLRAIAHALDTSELQLLYGLNNSGHSPGQQVITSDCAKSETISEKLDDIARFLEVPRDRVNIVIN